MDLNQYIDHTALSTTAKDEIYFKLFKEAQEHSFFSVCVPPHMVKKAKKNLAHSNVKVCSVAAFPNGYNALKSKQQEIYELFDLGCDEVDVVLNQAHVKNKDWDQVT